MPSPDAPPGRPAPKGLYLQYSVGPHACCLPCSWVEQVVPRVEVTPIPEAPGHVHGLLRYHGGVVPVIDLCTLLIHQPAAVKLSSRIILLRRAPNLPGVVLGVLAEKVLNVLEFSEDDCRFSGLPGAVAGLMSGRVADTPAGLIHILEPARLLALGAPPTAGVTLTAVSPEPA